MTFGRWVNAGSPVERFWKLFGAVFVLAVAARGILCEVAQRFRWSLFAERPFVTAHFWVPCVILAFGLAVGWVVMGVGKTAPR